MNTKFNRYDRITEKSNSAEQGFSLIETMIALTTLGVCLAYAMPLFLYAKINNSKSEVRAGALFVAQRVFDDIRSKKFDDIPLSDGKKNLAGNPVIIPNVADIANAKVDTTVTTSSNNKISLADSLLTNAFGRQYQTKIIYCEGMDDTPTPTPPICSTRNRKFKVEVSYNGSKVYDLEGTYTDFQ